MYVNAEGDQLSAKLLDLFDGEHDWLEEPEVLAHTPCLLAFLMFVPPYQMRSCLYILCDWLLAQHVLSGLDCCFDHGWLNANWQGYYHGIYVLVGEEIVEGVTGCGRRVIVCLDGLSRAFGKFVGGRFGARVDCFEGEERGGLDGWEMFCAEEIRLVKAITMMSKKGRAQTLSCKNPRSDDCDSD